MRETDPISPNPEADIWDAIVVGTGMGGATAGYALAKAGHRVLFLERGKLLHAVPAEGASSVAVAEDPETRMARGWWPFPLEGETSFGRQRFFAPMGCGSGGSSTLYAAQLERFRPEDFEPRANHLNVSGSSLPTAWPIAYRDLVPYYVEAEKLYRVRGSPDPLGDSGVASLLPPTDMSERDRILFESFAGLGLHPYRAHVGCEFLEGCQGCGGYLCARGCKSDAGTICLMPAIREHGAHILPECEVTALEADQHVVQGVRCRIGERQLVLRARVVILAAGAFASPALLLRSQSRVWPKGLANTSDQVGRNLMLHAHVWFAVGGTRRARAHGPLKSISLNDFYLMRAGKFGTVQSLGITLSPASFIYYLRTQIIAYPSLVRTLSKPLLYLIGYTLAQPFRNSAVFAGIIEDLPYSQNRVVLDQSTANGFSFRYQYPDELKQRCAAFTNEVRKTIGSRHRMIVVSGKNNLDYGHVCGTIRFGDDPKTSVLDGSNRAHELNNLYVVDASFLPSSGGTNLSLTIAANALRVSDIISRRLMRSAS